jgi:hypothetical protein
VFVTLSLLVPSSKRHPRGGAETPMALNSKRTLPFLLSTPNYPLQGFYLTMHSVQARCKLPSCRSRVPCTACPSHAQMHPGSIPSCVYFSRAPHIACLPAMRHALACTCHGRPLSHLAPCTRHPRRELHLFQVRLEHLLSHRVQCIACSAVRLALCIVLVDSTLIAARFQHRFTCKFCIFLCY